MFFDHRAFWLPKDVRDPSGYQDAFNVDAGRGIAAVADGVSSSLFSASWASILTKAIVAEPPNVHEPSTLYAWLGRQRQTWLAPIDVNSLAWHQKPKFQDGASTTLLWLQLSPADPGAPGPVQMCCHAIGDCNLFHLRGDRVLRAFPIENSRLFDTTPKSVCSIDKRQDHLLQFYRLVDHCQPGDLLVLCTDAVAAWALTELESGRSPGLEKYWTMTDDAWRQSILGLRQKQVIRFDDTTVVLLRIRELPSVVSSAAASPAESPLGELIDEAKKTVDGLVGDVKKTVGDVAKKLQETTAWKWLHGDK